MAWQNLISRVAERAGAGRDWMTPSATGDHLQASPQEGPRPPEHPTSPAAGLLPVGDTLQSTHRPPLPPLLLILEHVHLHWLGLGFFFHFFSFSCLEFLCSSKDLGDFILLNTSAISQTEVLKILFAVSHLVTESVLKWVEGFSFRDWTAGDD